MNAKIPYGRTPLLQASSAGPLFMFTVLLFGLFFTLMFVGVDATTVVSQAAGYAPSLYLTVHTCDVWIFAIV